MSELLAKVSQPEIATPTHDNSTNFLQTHYGTGTDYWRLQAIERTLTGLWTMHPNTRAVVMIPAHYTEMNLDRTLTEYAKQDLIDPDVMPGKARSATFELAVLVNGVHKQSPDLTETPAYQSALAFQKNNPQVPFTLARVTYPPKEATIGRIRRDLAALEIKRALLAPGVDVDNLVLITNDADLQRIPKDYVSSVISSFDANPQQAGLTGFIDYPKEDFDADHVFHVIQRFSDILDVIRRKRERRMTMHAGNSAFRLRNYIEAGGIRNNRAAELLPVYNELRRKDPTSIGYHGRGEGATIVTSSRRQLTANQKGVLFVDRYRHFGGEEDIASFWKKPKDVFSLPEHMMRYTNDHFAATIQTQLDALYRKLVSVTPQGSQMIQGEMKLAGTIVGIRLGFVKMSREKMESKGGKAATASPQEVEVLDISKLREAMRKAHNRF